MCVRVCGIPALCVENPAYSARLRKQTEGQTEAGARLLSASLEEEKYQLAKESI